MANRSRPFLKDKFQTGDTPTEENFADLIDSFISKVDDDISLDGNKNLTIPAGLNLTNVVTGQNGTLRYNGTDVEVFDGSTWNPISGGGGAFLPVGGGPNVAFTGGNVGIGNPVNPTHKLDIPLAPNSGPAEQVRLGNLAIHNGTTNEAYIGHQAAPTDNNYALKQHSMGHTTVNGTTVKLRQGPKDRLEISSSGNISLLPELSVSIRGTTTIGVPGDNLDLTIFGNLRVHGTASKTVPGSFAGLSDLRLKKDIRPFDVGLEQVLKLNPVYYKFNGEAGTPNDGKEHVGLIAQEVQKAIPSLVLKSEHVEADDKKDILTYNPDPILYALISAVKQLSEKIEKLESQLNSKSKGKG